MALAADYNKIRDPESQSRVVTRCFVKKQKNIKRGVHLLPIRVKHQSVLVIFKKNKCLEFECVVYNRYINLIIQDSLLGHLLIGRNNWAKQLGETVGRNNW